MKYNTTKIRVRYAETDQMGVVYHGNYAQYLEVGRIEWLREVGLSYKEMEENGIILPVISLNLKFLKSALYDDEISIKTILKKIPGVKIEFDYEVYNQNNEKLVTANTVLVFVDKETKRPVRCPDYVLDKIKRIDFS